MGPSGDYPLSPEQELRAARIIRKATREIKRRIKERRSHEQEQEEPE